MTLSLQEHPYRPVDLLELSVDGDALFVAHDEPVGHHRDDGGSA